MPVSPPQQYNLVQNPSSSSALSVVLCAVFVLCELVLIRYVPDTDPPRGWDSRSSALQRDARGHGSTAAGKSLGRANSKPRAPQPCLCSVLGSGAALWAQPSPCVVSTGVLWEWCAPWDVAAGLQSPLPAWDPAASPVCAEHLAPPARMSPCAALGLWLVCGGLFGGAAPTAGRRGLHLPAELCPPCCCPHVPPSSILPLIPLQADELSSPFGQISLSRQGSTEAPDPSSAMFQSSLISQHPQQTGFIMATPGQPIPTSSYSASGHTAPTQQVLQPQGYIQPPQQVRTRGDIPRAARPGTAGEWVPLLLLLVGDGSIHGGPGSGSHAPLLGTG